MNFKLSQLSGEQLDQLLEAIAAEKAKRRNQRRQELVENFKKAFEMLTEEGCIDVCTADGAYINSFHDFEFIY